jgi:hypothetical protein
MFAILRSSSGEVVCSALMYLERYISSVSVPVHGGKGGPLRSIMLRRSMIKPLLVTVFITVKVGERLPSLGGLQRVELERQILEL